MVVSNVTKLTIGEARGKCPDRQVISRPSVATMILIAMFASQAGSTSSSLSRATRRSRVAFRRRVPRFTLPVCFVLSPRACSGLLDGSVVPSVMVSSFVCSSLRCPWSEYRPAETGRAPRHPSVPGPESPPSPEGHPVVRRRRGGTGASGPDTESRDNRTATHRRGRPPPRGAGSRRLPCTGQS